MFRKIRNIFKIADYDCSGRLSKEDLLNFKDEDIAIGNIKDGIDNAERRLQDLLSTKKSMEYKAVNIFKSQITIASIILAIVNTDLIKITDFTLWLVLASVVLFIAGSIFSLFCLQVANYGAVGGHPINWLQENIIKEEKNLKKLSLLNLDCYVERLDISEKSNKQKAQFLQFSIWLLIVAIIPLVISLFNLF